MWNRAIRVGILFLVFAAYAGAGELQAETKSYQIRVFRADLQSREPRPWEGVALKSIEAQAPARREDFNCAPRSDANGIIQCQVTCFKGGNKVKRYYDVELEESVSHNAERRQNIAVNQCNFLPKVMDIKYVHINLLAIINADRSISRIIGRYPKMERAIIGGIDVAELTIALAEISSSPEGLKDVKTLAMISSEIAALLGVEDEGAGKKYAPITMAAANALLATTSRNIYVLGGGASPTWSASDYDQNIAIFTSNLEKAKKNTEGTQWPFDKVYSLALEAKGRGEEATSWGKSLHFSERQKHNSGVINRDIYDITTPYDNDKLYYDGFSSRSADKSIKFEVNSNAVGVYAVGLVSKFPSSALTKIRSVSIGEINSLVEMVDEAKIGRDMTFIGITVDTKF